MRKFLVALLILSVVGGAFAQEDSKWSWGTVSGSAELGTTIDLLPLGEDFNQINNTPGPNGSVLASDADYSDEFVAMYRGAYSASFNATWELANGDWAITLPIKLDGGIFGTTDGDGNSNAKVVYNPGPLKVELPFKMLFTGGPTPVTFADASANISYEEDVFGAAVGFDNIFSGATLAKVGGYYGLLDNSLQFRVSHGGAYGSEWWRASTIVLNKLRVNGGAWFIPNGDNDASDYKWENMGDDGFALRYFFTPDFQAGISFANNSGAAMFTERDPADSDVKLTLNNKDFIEDFLTQPTFGLKYAANDLAIAAMLGFWWSGAEFEKTLVPAYAGVSYKISDDFRFGVDTTALFGQENPNLNIGADVVYGNDGASDGNFWVYGLVKGLNLLDKSETTTGKDPLPVTTKTINGIPDFSAHLSIGWNKSRDGDNAFGGDKGKGFWTGAYFSIPDLMPDDGEVTKVTGTNVNTTTTIENALSLEFGAIFGYKGLDLTENLVLSAEASVKGFVNGDETTKYEGRTDANDNYTLTAYRAAPAFKIELAIAPELVWSIWTNGSITFGYSLKADNAQVTYRTVTKADIDNEDLNTGTLVEGDTMVDKTPAKTNGKKDAERRILEPEQNVFGFGLTEHKLSITFKWSF